MKKIIVKFKRIAIRIGMFQARMLLGILYFSAVMPYGLGVRFFSDPLAVKKKKNGGSNWTPRAGVVPTDEDSKRQY